MLFGLLKGPKTKHNTLDLKAKYDEKDEIYFLDKKGTPYENKHQTLPRNRQEKSTYEKVIKVLSSVLVIIMLGLFGYALLNALLGVIIF